MQSTTLLQEQDPQPSPELADLTLQLYDALGRGDAGFIADRLSRSAAVRVIGTDPDEWWGDHSLVVRVLEAQMREVGGFAIAGGSPEAYSKGTIGWSADRPVIRLPDGDVPTRLTLLFQREDAEWKIIQWHISVGVRNEDVLGQELPTE